MQKIISSLTLAFALAFVSSFCYSSEALRGTKRACDYTDEEGNPTKKVKTVLPFKNIDTDSIGHALSFLPNTDLANVRLSSAELKQLADPHVRFYFKHTKDFPLTNEVIQTTCSNNSLVNKLFLNLHNSSIGPQMVGMLGHKVRGIEYTTSDKDYIMWRTNEFELYENEVEAETAFNNWNLGQAWEAALTHTTNLEKIVLDVKYSHDSSNLSSLFEGLKRCKKLTDLKLYSYSNKHQLVFNGITELDNLTNLTLEICDRSLKEVDLDNFINKLQLNKNLKFLKFQFDTITYNFINKINLMTQLETFELKLESNGFFSFDPTINIVEGFKSLTNLKTLLLTMCMNEEGWAALSTLTQLEHLTLKYCSLTNADLMKLLDLKKLTRLKTLTFLEEYYEDESEESFGPNGFLYQSDYQKKLRDNLPHTLVTFEK